MLADINLILHPHSIHIQRTGPTNSLMGLFVGIGIVAAVPSSGSPLPSLPCTLFSAPLARPDPSSVYPPRTESIYFSLERGPDIRAVAAAEKAYEPCINDVRVRNITTPHPCLFCQVINDVKSYG